MIEGASAESTSTHVGMEDVVLDIPSNLGDMETPVSKKVRLLSFVWCRKTFLIFGTLYASIFLDNLGCPTVCQFARPLQTLNTSMLQ